MNPKEGDLIVAPKHRIIFQFSCDTTRPDGGIHLVPIKGSVVDIVSREDYYLADDDVQNITYDCGICREARLDEIESYSKVKTV